MIKERPGLGNWLSRALDRHVKGLVLSVAVTAMARACQRGRGEAAGVASQGQVLVRWILSVQHGSYSLC